MSAEIKLYADGNDITAYAGNLSWKNTIAELATTMSFDIAKSDTKHINLYTPTVGSIISMVTNTEIFRGIVLSCDDGSNTSNKYTISDFGWYLNKSKETYQFNKMPAYKAIQKVCEDFGIPIDSIPSLTTEITQIYMDKTISEIISDILEKCGGNFSLDMTPIGIRIYKFGDIYAYPEFRITPNTHLIYSPTLKGGNSHSLSIADMKNSVKVISEKDNVFTLQASLKDDESIGKYGLLQEVVKIDPEKENPQSTAQAKLSELDVIKETHSFEMIEAVDSYTRAGSVIMVDDVNYLIESTDHSIKNGVHYVKVEIKNFG